jgi:hypothetical protein
LFLVNKQSRTLRTALLSNQSDAVVNAAILGVLSDILGLTHSLTSPYHANIVHTFLFATHLRSASSGRVGYGQISTIGNVCAKMMFILKGAVLKLVDAADGRLVDQKAALDLLNLSGDGENSFSVLVSMLKIVQTFTANSQANTTVKYGVNSLGRVDLTVFVVNEVTVPLEAIHTGARRLMEKLSDCLRICQYGMEFRDAVFDDIVDDLTSNRLGYYFGTVYTFISFFSYVQHLCILCYFLCLHQ